MATKKSKVSKETFALKAIKKNVILKVNDKELVSKGGIVLTSADREEASKGKVMAIGPDAEYVEVGQTVLPNWNKAKKIKHEMVEYWIIDEDEIVLIYDGE